MQCLRTVTRLAVAFAAVGGLSTSAVAQRAGQSISIQHGVVVAAESVQMASAAGGGALVGGLAGYVSSSGKRSSKRVRDAIIGSAVGGAVASSAEGSRQGVRYSVDTGAGEIVVVSDQTEIEIGDCVAVENAGTGAANIRRVSTALCESADPVDDVVETELLEDATECLAAKDEVLAAETDEVLERAIRKAKILCNS